MASPKIAIFNDTHGWHSQQLVDALAPLGVAAVLTDLADCRIDLDQPTGLLIPGFEDALPAAAMVRGIAPGSLEQITLRMDVLHTLAELNVPVFNPASAIEHTVDKARTSLRLHLAGINTPKTWACENTAMAREIAHQQFKTGHQLVMKPLFGCQGKGVVKITSLAEFDAQVAVGDAFYLQQYIESMGSDSIDFPRNGDTSSNTNQSSLTPLIWQDWRLMVVDGEVCAAMSRTSDHWITNFAQGAVCSSTELTDEMLSLAIAATEAVNAEYAGVDLIRQQDGSFTVLEVNSVPAWKGLAAASGVDVAGFLARAIARRVQA